MIAAIWVLAATPAPTSVNSGPSGEAAKAGPLWAVVVGALAVACLFLFRSMLRHLRRVREDFPSDVYDPSAPVAVTQTGTDSAAPAVASVSRPPAKDRRRH